MIDDAVVDIATAVDRLRLALVVIHAGGLPDIAADFLIESRDALDRAIRNMPPDEDDEEIYCSSGEAP